MIGKAVFVICDRCMRASQGEFRTVREARDDARIGGWRMSGRGDFCPECDGQ